MLAEPGNNTSAMAQPSCLPSWQQAAVVPVASSSQPWRHISHSRQIDQRPKLPCQSSSKKTSNRAHSCCTRFRSLHSTPPQLQGSRQSGAGHWLQPRRPHATCTSAKFSMRALKPSRMSAAGQGGWGGRCGTSGGERRQAGCRAANQVLLRVAVGFDSMSCPPRLLQARLAR